MRVTKRDALVGASLATDPAWLRIALIWGGEEAPQATILLAEHVARADDRAASQLLDLFTGTANKIASRFR